MNCNFLPKAAKECSSFVVFVRWKLGLFVVYLMLFGLELSDLTKLLTVIGHVPSLPTTNSLELKLHDVVWLLPALEHNHFSPKIVKYFTYIVGAMWWGMGRNSEIFIITIRLEQTRSVTWRRKNIFLWIIHCQEEAWIYRKVWARMIF